jgi:integrase
MHIIHALIRTTTKLLRLLLGLPVSTDYRPAFSTARWAVIEQLVTDAATWTSLATDYTERRLVAVAAPFADWVVNVSGYPVKDIVVFHPVMVRRYISRTDVTWTDTTRRSYRSVLMRISETVNTAPNPVPFAPTSTQQALAPYTPVELDLLEAWARGQATGGRRRSAGTVLALCAGAGLKPNELLQVRRRDIVIDEIGIQVIVTPKPRIVPVLARFENLLRDAITDIPDDVWVFGSPMRTRHGVNTVNMFIRDTQRSQEPDPVTTRMRNTWLITHLTARTDLRSLMAAAGVTKFDNLDLLTAYVPALEAGEFRRQLRAEVAR